MAETLDGQQLNELASFVNALADLAGYKTNTQWALEAGYLRNELGQVRLGRKGVSGYNLLKLIRAAAARSGLQPEEAAVRAGLAAPDDPRQISARLEALSEKVDVQGNATTTSLKSLAAGIRRIERRLDAGAPPANRAGDGQ